MNSAEVVIACPAINFKIYTYVCPILAHQERPATSVPLEDMIFHICLFGVHKGGNNEHHC